MRLEQRLRKVEQGGKKDSNIGIIYTGFVSPDGSSRIGFARVKGQQIFPNDTETDSEFEARVEAFYDE